MSESPKTPMLRMRAYILSGLFVFLLIAGGIYYQYFYTKQATNSAKQAQGLIYLTLDHEGGYLPSLISLDPRTNHLNLLLNDGNANITGSVSRDKRYLAYIGISPKDPTPQIMMLDMKKGTKEAITSSLTVYKREVDWSPLRDRIAFMARSSKVGGISRNPDDWTVYVTDLAGEEMVVGSGAHPHWSPDGKKIVLLKRDGVHVYNVVTRKDELVWGVAPGGVAGTDMKLDVSDDGTRIAWSNVFGGEIVIRKITSWNPFTTAADKTIKTNGSDIAFSPNGKGLAVKEVDVQGDTLSNTRVVVYLLDTLVHRTLINLGQYVQTGIFLTDWK